MPFLSTLSSVCDHHTPSISFFSFLIYFILFSFVDSLNFLTPPTNYVTIRFHDFFFPLINEFRSRGSKSGCHHFGFLLMNGLFFIYTSVNTGAIAPVCTYFLNYINN